MLCREMLGSLSAYIDGELEAELCANIDRHLAECHNCHVVVDTLRRTVLLYHEHGHEPLPEDVKERLLTALALTPSPDALQPEGDS